jgi:hypothetical protein
MSRQPQECPPTNTLRLCRQIMNVACLVLFGFISLRVSGRLVCRIQSKTVVFWLSYALFVSQV